ncbi:MAG: NUDIX hydrolase [Ignavibacteriales bacterium]|nr:NUDIX hydrolase [Ignavibacteriales bacterium]
MLKRWKTLSSKILFKNPWWTYKLDEFEIPDGIKGEYNYVFTRGSSLVVPVTNDGKIILVNQYRYLCDRESIEFPCGGVKEGKSYEEMANIELEEETGYRASDLKFAGEFNPFNGVTSEICHVYIARNLVRSQQKPDATEEFEIHYKSPDEIESLIVSNQIWDGMTMAAWGLVKHKL